jgi:hypothetical protein
MVERQALESFILEAKRTCYVGDGRRAAPSRRGSHDLVHGRGEFAYRDSYFGGTDFQGQEVVWLGREPVWVMSYSGYVLRPELIDAARAGATIKAALSAMYAEGRFLGGFEWTGPHGVYTDTSRGDVTRFSGREWIAVDGVEAYALDYFGGLIRP